MAPFMYKFIMYFTCSMGVPLTSRKNWIVDKVLQAYYRSYTNIWSKYLFFSYLLSEMGVVTFSFLHTRPLQSENLRNV